MTAVGVSLGTNLKYTKCNATSHIDLVFAKFEALQHLLKYDRHMNSILISYQMFAIIFISDLQVSPVFER